MRKLALVVSVLFVWPASAAEPLSAEGFQSLRWGMSRAQAKKALPGAKPLGKEDLRWSLTIAGHAATVEGAFADDRLAVISVIFEAGLFDELAEILKKKYPEPPDATNDGELWFWAPDSQVVLYFKLNATQIIYRSRRGAEQVPWDDRVERSRAAKAKDL